MTSSYAARTDARSTTTPEPTEPVLAYDGAAPFPVDTVPPHARDRGERLSLVITAAIVALPFIGLGLALTLLWGRFVHLSDVLLALVLYVVTGLGVTIGFHRGLTHGGFTARRPLRIALAVAGSMSFQGNVVDWVATHRRHHAFTDRPGDPHSPYRYGTGPGGLLRGLLDAHVGWLFRHDPTPADRYAPDLLADPDMRAVARAFPALCLLTLALPLAWGWIVGGTWVHALVALLWAGLVRIALLHHVTWSVNSLCHMVGRRPFRTRKHDRATNLWPLALLSFGEGWHNLHHSDPTSARHGVDRGQLDPSAAVIRVFERLGWVSDVRWPSRDRVAARRA
ncbi:acyl-CoA desaturase [Streptomyces sp. NPDC001941]|uniref:acyl-CoA desaturase n=1 Tax=Streptomyces sp. NPDC001941 TaxID=3154659 RepID=UPI0033258E7A